MLKAEFKSSPFKTIVLLYTFFTLFFALLYELPVARHQAIPFVDVLFLSASAMSVTGLSTISVADELTRLGDVILMIQLQFGGIGIMAIVGSLLLFVKRDASLHQQTLMSFDQNQKGLRSVKQLMIFIFSFSIGLEFLSALIFLPTFYSKTGDWSESIFLSVFHSISSFTNGGFDLFNDSLRSFSTDSSFVLTSAFLSFCGILGFPIVLELVLERGRRKSLFLKVSLLVSVGLLVAGFLFFLVSEYNHSLAKFSWMDKIGNALFLSMTSRNGGMSTVDVGTLQSPTLMVLMVLMFIGGSPSSCGGGIRTTTFGVLIAKVFNVVRGRRDVVMFKRSLHEEDVDKAYVIFFFFFTLFFVTTIFLSFFEPFTYEQLSFEVMSALSTTGLSTGITSQLSLLSKSVLIVLMLIGRIGIIALLYTFIQPKKSSIQYAKESIIVG